LKIGAFAVRENPFPAESFRAVTFFVWWIGVWVASFEAPPIPAMIGD
jgi:hypothetical protein